MRRRAVLMGYLPVAMHGVSSLEGAPCVVCGGPMRIRIRDWSARCERCRSWASNLPVGGSEVHSDVRTTGLEALRRENFRVILGQIASLRPLDGVSLLDVGSAHGWFVEEATRRGARAVGIEPDARLASESAGEVRVGLFPDAVADTEMFDVIAFNDVLEHLGDVRGALAACREHLLPAGLLSVNIPTADGLAFRIACGLAYLWIHGPYERLWQHGLPSPHLHYFTTRALVELLVDEGFDVVSVREVRAITRDGLWERVHTVGWTGPMGIVSFAFLYLAAGLLNRRGASDVVHIVARVR
jgi:SAM-dependent methyltransferase